VTRLIGEKNVSSLPLDALSSKFDAESLIGKQLNISSESEQVNAKTETELKKYTGGDKVTVDRKFEKVIEYYPTVRFWLMTNRRPQFQDTKAMFDRMIYMPYRVYIPPEERIDNLPEILCEELPGIFNWSVEGLRRVRKNGQFTHSTVCEKALEDYKKEVNPARQFLEDFCQPGDPELVNVPCTDLYNLYKRWSQENGHKLLDSGRLGREVAGVFKGVKRARKMVNGKRGAYCYYGIWVPSELWPLDLSVEAEHDTPFNWPS
jgi:putative DNA primase/helicase